MKPIFGICKDNRTNPNDNSDVFMVAKTSEALLAEYDKINIPGSSDLEADKTFREHQRKQIGRLLTAGAVLSLVVLILIVATGQLKQFLEEDLFLLIVPIVYIIIFGIYMFYTRVLSKKKAEGADMQEPNPESALSSILNDPRVKEIDHKIYASLRVPDSAEAVDILSFFYKTEDGAPVPQEKEETVAFTNNEMQIFREGDTLCLANVYARYELPLGGLGSIKTVQGEFSLFPWDKSVPCDADEYRDYHLKKDSDDSVAFNAYHILELEKDGEQYGLYFPCYELPVIKHIIEG